jgi:four helix bundle protein
MEPRELETRSFEFGVAVLRLARLLKDEMPNSVLDALVQSSTSVGSEVIEAHGSSSSSGYLSGLMSARKASQQSAYWLRLIGAADPERGDLVQPLLAESLELAGTLGSLCNRARIRAEAAKHR